MSDTPDSSTRANNTAHATRGSQTPTPTVALTDVGVQTTTEPPALSVATFNMLHGRRQGRRYWPPAFTRALAQFDVDVLALQEVDRRMAHVAWADLAERAGKVTGLHASFGKARRRYDLGFSGNALLARSVPRDVSTLTLFRNSIGHETRCAHFATVTHGKTDWRVASTHLSSHREESAVQLEQIWEAFGDFPGPCVLMGDFNLRPHEVAERLAGSPWSFADTDDTYPSWDPFLRIDYVVTRGCRTEAIHVGTSELSDHRPVFAILSVGGDDRFADGP